MAAMVSREALRDVASTYLMSLEAISDTGGDPARTSVLLLESFRSAKKGFVELLSVFEYPEEMHAEASRLALRYYDLNPVFLTYIQDKKYRPLVAQVRTITDSALEPMVDALADYASLLETTPREYFLAAMGEE